MSVLLRDGKVWTGFIAGRRIVALTIGYIASEGAPWFTFRLAQHRNSPRIIPAACAVIFGLAATLSAQAPLKIVSPANGSLFRPGDTVTITTNRCDDVQVAPHWQLQHSIGPVVEEKPCRFSFVLSPDLPAGTYRFTALDFTEWRRTGFRVWEESVSVEVEIDVEPIWPPSADGSTLVDDGAGVTVDTGGIPLRHRSGISYPAEALAQGIEGTVVVEVTPDWEGLVEGVHVLSGPHTLSRHVILALSSWHFAKGVGNIKARRLSITFDLNEARRGQSSGRIRGTTLRGNMRHESRLSGDRNRLYNLKTLSILGLSEDEAGRLRSIYENNKILEGAEVSEQQLDVLQAVAGGSDHDLRTHFYLEGRQLSVAIAPIGFIAGVTEEGPPIKTEAVRSGADLEQEFPVSAADQARKLVLMVPPQYPGNSDWNYVQGVVRVQFIVDKDGRVIKANAGGPSLLREVAEEAVKQWKYSPTMMNGRAVKVLSEVYLDFFLPY